jgi:hypothetical protein
MTTADYLNQLEQDRQDLVDNLETKGITGLTGDETFTELVPEVLNIPSGGTPSINTYTELKDELISVMNSYSNYLKGKVASYPAYTTNSVTLYTPNIQCTSYVIHKNSSGKYRVIWFPSPNVVMSYINQVAIARNSSSNSMPTFDLSTLEYNTTNFNPSPSFAYNPTTMLFYYSNYLDTITDVITNMQLQNGSLTYTQWTSGASFSGVQDTPYKIPYTNSLVFDITNENLDSQIISHNETIVAIS